MTLVKYKFFSMTKMFLNPTSAGDLGWDLETFWSLRKIYIEPRSQFDLDLDLVFSLFIYLGSKIAINYVCHSIQEIKNAVGETDAANNAHIFTEAILICSNLANPDYSTKRSIRWLLSFVTKPKHRFFQLGPFHQKVNKV